MVFRNGYFLLENQQIDHMNSHQHNHETVANSIIWSELKNRSMYKILPKPEDAKSSNYPFTNLLIRAK
jgi:5-methylcytosine-specific restriction endonuclease McrA